MQPHERIRYLFYVILRKIATLLGHDIFDKDGLKLNAISYFLYGLNAAGLSSTIYTFFMYDITTGLNSIGYGAINCEVSLKFKFVFLNEIRIL